MATVQGYLIGKPGVPWGEAEKAQWLEKQRVQRSYEEHVLQRLSFDDAIFSQEKYGQLNYANQRFELLAVKSNQWHHQRPTLLVTGGVHGYETSGVQGALLFLTEHASDYAQHANVVVMPCISPWGYETINRWNPMAIDPNRSFYAGSPSQEAALAMNFVKGLGEVACHIDLHETTDTDNSEFRPALAARDGIENHNWNIPDGFYVVGDSDNPQPEFQRAIIDSVSNVTHIAPADDDGKIIGAPLEQQGVIHYPMKKLGLCGGMTNARYVSTTEVYPDSPQATDEICQQAQVAAIRGGFNFVLDQI